MASAYIIGSVAILLGSDTCLTNIEITQILRTSSIYYSF